MIPDWVVHVRVLVLVMVVSTGGTVRVEMHVQPWAGRLSSCDHVDAAMLHATRGEHLVRELAELVCSALKNDDLEAVSRVEVNVHRGPHLTAQTMLQLVQTLGEITDVMVVDEGHGGDDVCIADVSARDLGTCQVA